MITISSFNREQIQSKYIDYLISHMDFIEVRRHLWDYLNEDKKKYTDEALQKEINKRAPEVLEKYFAGNLHLEGYQNV